MKKIGIFLFIMAFAMSCSSDDTEGKLPESVSETPISAGLELNFVSASGGSDFTNLRVDDYMVIGYKITGGDLQEDEAFAITPLSGGPISHQVLGVDYDLYYKGQKVENFYTLEKEGEFTIHIKKPGNFRHVYELSKIKKDSADIPAQNVGKGEIFFNSVRIVAYSYTIRTRKGNTWKHSRWDTYYKFFIDTGNEHYDTYLDGLSSQVYYDNQTSNQTDFRNKTSKDFHPVEGSERSGGKYRVEIINKIIFKKEINGLVTNIEYTNIPVWWYDRQDKWGDRGTENL